MTHAPGMIKAWLRGIQLLLDQICMGKMIVLYHQSFKTFFDQFLSKHKRRISFFVETKFFVISEENMCFMHVLASIFYNQGIS